MDFKNRY